MKRYGFLLGLLSTAGQVLLLRELVASFYGDELFLGTALFGWLAAVAVGSYAGGRRLRHRPRIELTFGIGSLQLPLMIVAVRLLPPLVNPVVGEVLPFGKAALFSMLAMGPLGLAGGWLFSVIAGEGVDPGESIIQVYLYEGIGAFVGGVAVTLAAGTILSTLGLSVAVTIVVITAVIARPSFRAAVLMLGASLVLLAGLWLIFPAADAALEELRYPGYELAASFDTPYGRQIILNRGGETVVMTDNTIEIVSPDRQTFENLIITPLLYKPGAMDILVVGRAEWGGDVGPGRSLTMLDPRKKLSAVLDSVLPKAALRRIDRDPVSYFARHDGVTYYDIIILNTGQFDSYRSSRLVTPENLRRMKEWLRPGGLICLPGIYDTDRYISPAVEPILATVGRTLGSVFKNVSVWPGSITPFLASDETDLHLSLDTILARLDLLALTTDFISIDYLFDRLEPMRQERINAVLAGEGEVNSSRRPRLTHYQALYRSSAYPSDYAVLSRVLSHPRWLIFIPLLFVLSLAACLRRRRRHFPLILFFTAGLVSLSLELLAFYAFQNAAGSLYSEMALLIGTFMFGLALGTWYAHKGSPNSRVEIPALIMLLATVLVFLSLHDRVVPGAILLFHSGFLFVTAVGTGALFVGAANRYYGVSPDANRGAGYTADIAGSALGALVTVTVALPVLGMTGILAVIAAILALALAGSLLSKG